MVVFLNFHNRTYIERPLYVNVMITILLALIHCYVTVYR